MKNLDDDMREKGPLIPPGNFNLIEHPFRPTRDYTRIEGLVERVQALHGQRRLQTALNEIFKALDAHPGHPEPLMLAMFIAGVSRTDRFQAQEPISEASFADRRLDPILAVCSHCRKSQWVPKGFIIPAREVDNPIGVQCYNCGYVVCRDCLPLDYVAMGPPFIEKTCPHCHQKQLGVPVFPTGRLSLGSPRSATPLVRIIVFREGPIPPDGEDIHELLEHISPDALETPGVEISTFPVPVWPADIAALAHTILQDMEDKGELPPGSVSSAIGWPFQKKEHGIHGYLVKVSQPSPEQARIIMNEQEAEKEKGIGAPTNTLEDEVERREEQGFLKKFWRSFLLLGQPISGKKRQSARSPDSIPAPPSPRASAQEPTFDEVTTRDVTKAIDVLFNEALCAVPAMTPSTIEAAYEVLRKHWASRALYNGKQTQMREIVSHNLVLLARRTDFLYFMIKNGRDDAGEHYVQVYALMGKTIASRGTAVAIRLWRSQERIFACGHAGFEESPKAVLEEVSQKVLLELEDLVKQHVVHARRPFADDISALQWDLLLRSDILAFTTHSIARLTPLSTQNGTHACLGRRLSDAIVVVSVVPALMPSYAMTYFPKGYMETLVALMNRYEFDRKGSSPFIHWIYCFDSNAQMIHLSFLSGASEASAMLVAQDLLSREEKTQIGIL